MSPSLLPSSSCAGDICARQTSGLTCEGNLSGMILSARLKALGVDSLIIDRNRQDGDNWALRYDCLRFHISKANCETPYLRMYARLSFYLGCAMANISVCVSKHILTSFR